MKSGLYPYNHINLSKKTGTLNDYFSVHLFHVNELLLHFSKECAGSTAGKQVTYTLSTFSFWPLDDTFFHKYCPIAFKKLLIISGLVGFAFVFGGDSNKIFCINIIMLVQNGIGCCKTSLLPMVHTSKQS